MTDTSIKMAAATPARSRRKDRARSHERFTIGGRVMAGATLAFLLVGGVGGWAATTQLTGAIVAHGTVSVDQKLNAIQHRDGGIVSQIAVREGDMVEAGQVLIRLEDAQTRAELAILSAQISELRIKRARLMAEREGAEAIAFDLADHERADPAIAVLVNGEERLFAGNITHRQSQKQQLELSIAQIDEEVRGLAAQQSSKAGELALVRTEHAKIRGLADKGLVEGSRVYAIERDLARLTGEEGEIAAAIARAGARQSELRLQIIAIDESARTDAQRELSLLETRLAELEERADATTDRLARTDIRAPGAGTVNELKVHTVGGVITPAEILATIVPEDARLRVQTRIAPHMIDQVDIDKKARLRFTAFNQRTTPELTATVAHLSPATSTDPATGETFYTATLDIDQGQAQKLGPANLMPGMPVEVYISTDERTPLSYLVKPIADQLQKTFRER